MLNPDRNLYSVAPVGNIVVIGRNATLKGGLSRDNALNLVAWLILATTAKPEEIAAILQEASLPIAKTIEKPTETIAKTIEKPTEEPAKGIAAFIGAIDDEEKAAIGAVSKRQLDLVPKAIDEDGLITAWAGVK